MLTRLARRALSDWGGVARDQGARAGEVTLVIDDGPAESTAELMAALESGGHRATFFLIGANVEGREAILADAVRRGFALGNHSFDHPHFSEIGVAEARASIEKTEALIDAVYREAAVPRPGKWFRFPYLDFGGEQAAAIQTLLRELKFERPWGMTSRIWDEDQGRVDWPTTVCTWDWELPPETKFRARVRSAEPGDIVEFHDNRDTVGRYARLLSEELSRRGLRATVPSTTEPEPVREAE